MTDAGPSRRPDRFGELEREIVACRDCPRLVAHREKIAREKKKAFADREYWGRAVPGFGARTARIVVVGLAPGAHGANRTGRVFTGDDSGRLLYDTLHRVGLSNRSESHGPQDGLRLSGVWITGAVRCVPPGNKPSREEIERCAGYFERELRLLRRARVYVALGKIAWDRLRRSLPSVGKELPARLPAFGHGVSVELPGGRGFLFGSYHPSRQNTNTGRLTPSMFLDVFREAAAAAER